MSIQFQAYGNTRVYTAEDIAEFRAKTGTTSNDEMVAMQIANQDLIHPNWSPNTAGQWMKTDYGFEWKY